MNKKWFALLLVSLLGLVGCGPKRYDIIEKTTYVYVGTPKTLTSQIKPQEPPAVGPYLELQCTGQRAEMVKWGASNLKITKLLNLQMLAIEKIDATNRESVEKMNQAENERVAKLIGQRVKEREDAR